MQRTTSITGQITEFDLHVQEHPHPTRVRLFDTVENLRAYASMAGETRPVDALCIKRHFAVAPVEPTVVAEVLYCTEHSQPSVLAHELGHAALAYEYSVYRNEALSLLGEAEERFMDTQQQLLDQLLFKFEELSPDFPEFFDAEEAEDEPAGEGRINFHLNGNRLHVSPRHEYVYFNSLLLLAKLPVTRDGVNIAYTMTYRNPVEGSWATGSITQQDTLRLCEGMVINIADTNNA